MPAMNQPLAALEDVSVSTGPGALGNIDRLCVDTIRTLAIDAVERAGSGHPGMPMAMAPVAYLLYAKIMRHNPGDPFWPDRDRFVLSAGHGSMLLYAALHLSGYELALEDLMAFRQWGSRTPGHPEHGLTPGVETTTGPLGQGFANGVGMAMAERFLRERYGEEVCDHRVFALCSDGDLMEGISSEAASLAGHLGLGQLIYLYDDNRITIDGDTGLSFDSEDVDARFGAYGWHVVTVEDVNDLVSLQRAIELSIDEHERPSLIRVRSVIAYGAPTKAGTPGSHGAPLGVDEVRATKAALGLDPELSFEVSPEAYAGFDGRERGARLEREWSERVDAWRASSTGSGNRVGRGSLGPRVARRAANVRNRAEARHPRGQWPGDAGDGRSAADDDRGLGRPGLERRHAAEVGSRLHTLSGGTQHPLRRSRARNGRDRQRARAARRQRASLRGDIPSVR
jgi:transketolase